MPSARLKIRRGGAVDAPSWSIFDLPFELGESVLDGLRRIQKLHDPSLGFRFSCINANACKECMVLVDGRVSYTCTARLEAREMTLEPLANKTLHRDLVTEIAPPDERLHSS